MRRGARREAGVVREVVDQLTGSGSAEDDLLDAGVEAVEVEDVAGGSWPLSAAASTTLPGWPNRWQRRAGGSGCPTPSGW
jgi:hypothetical protein